MKIALVLNEYQQRGGEDVVFEQEFQLLQRNGHHVTPTIEAIGRFNRILELNGWLWRTGSSGLEKHGENLPTWCLPTNRNSYTSITHS